MVGLYGVSNHVQFQSVLPPEKYKSFATFRYKNFEISYPFSIGKKIKSKF